MRRTRIFAAVGAGLLSAGIVSAAPQPATAPAPLQVVVAGTVHQALFAIGFDGALGVAVGAGGEVQESRDQGLSWKTVTPAPTALALLGVAVSGERAVAVGQTGLVLTRAADGAWSAADSGSRNRLLATALNGAGRAVAVGAFGTVLLSEDGGRQWRSIAPAWAQFAPDGMEPHVYTAQVGADGAITIAGEFGLILRSSDAGASWSLQHQGDASLFALQLREDGVGYAVGQSGLILRSDDHGASWTEQVSGSGALLLGVHASADGKIVVTAMRELLVSGDGGRHWRRLNDPAVKSAWWVGVAQAAPDAPVLAVGQAGQIVRVTP
jgi:photosystem II stability/assembly factor-like uncharacterized protein